MYQKIINFLKYHNLVSIVFTIVFVSFSLSLAASPQLREAIYSKKESEIGIDNTLLLATNLDNWDFQPQILSIEEDDENYYVTYRFKTLAVVDNVWQETFKEKLLQFPKVVLGNRDLADYITEEISEVILFEHQVLKDTQKLAQKEGAQQRVKVIEYSGLIGKILDLKPKVKPIEPQVAQIVVETSRPEVTSTPEMNQTCGRGQCETETQKETPRIDEKYLRELIEKILAEKRIFSQPTEVSPLPTSTPEPSSAPEPLSTPESSSTLESSQSPEPLVSPIPEPTPSF